MLVVATTSLVLALMNTCGAPHTTPFSLWVCGLRVRYVSTLKPLPPWGQGCSGCSCGLQLTAELLLQEHACGRDTWKWLLMNAQPLGLISHEHSADMRGLTWPFVNHIPADS